LCSYNPENGESEIYTEFNSDLTTNILMGSMDLDESGNIWLSTDDEGIMVFNPQTKEFYNIKKTDSENSITSNHVYTLYFDNQNFLWVGTFDEGVCYYDPDRYKFAPSLYKPNDLTILSGKSVISIFQDSEERIWVGTDGDGLLQNQCRWFYHRISPQHIQHKYP
jgi:ligand-binding sensor domain-containing protein